MDTHLEQREEGEGLGTHGSPDLAFTPGRPTSFTPQIRSQLPSSPWFVWDLPSCSTDSPIPRAHRGPAAPGVQHSVPAPRTPKTLQHFIQLKCFRVYPMRPPLTPSIYSLLSREATSPEVGVVM